MNAHEYDGKYNVTDDGNCLEPIGNGDLFNKGTCYGSLVCNTGEFHGSCSLHFMCVIDIITLGIILVSWKKLEHRTRRVHLIVFMQTGLRLNIGR